MTRFLYICVILSVAGFVAAKSLNSITKKVPTHDKMVVCTTSTANDLKDFKFRIENADLNLCTHLICIDSIYEKIIEPWNTKDNRLLANYKEFTNLRHKFPHLKVSLTAKYSRADYIRIAGNKNRRTKFVEKVTDFLLSHKFDGLDLIWDFTEPTIINDEPHRDNVNTFMQELMTSFETQNLLLTATFIGLDKLKAETINLPALSENFDFINLVQKYNYVETWPGSYRVEDVLKERAVSNFEDTVDGIIELGVPASKIILGLQFVGLSFHAVLDLAPKSATFRRTIAYNDVCRTLANDKKADWEKFYDEESGLSIAKDESKSWRGILKSTNVIIYESSRSIANKVRYIVNRKLAGAMAFAVEMDDFRGNCGIEEDVFGDFNLGAEFDIPNRQNATHPLLKTISYAFEVAPLETEARLPNKDKILFAANRINEIDSDIDVTAKIPDQYKPLIPLVFAVNDAMVVGYDKMKERAELYDKEQSYGNLMFLYMMKMSRMLMFVLGAALFGRVH